MYIMPSEATGTIKRIAAITMVRNDHFFLQKWVSYYGSQLGRENLYVLFDGKDQEVPEYCKGLHWHICDRAEGNVRQGDKRRIRIISSLACKLFRDGYQAVIGGDADEYLVVDPSLGISLKEMISRLKGSSASALGIDVGQDTRTEMTLDTHKSVLSQRHAAKLSTRYTKASIMLAPGSWGSGYHRQTRRNFSIVPGLYLFHIGMADLNTANNKVVDLDLTLHGWDRHLSRRMRTITLCSTRQARDFDRWTHLARTLQTWCRPPYAWNKPAMFNMDVIVSIPARFSDIL